MKYLLLANPNNKGKWNCNPSTIQIGEIVTYTANFKTRKILENANPSEEALFAVKIKNVYYISKIMEVIRVYNCSSDLLVDFRCKKEVKNISLEDLKPTGFISECLNKNGGLKEQSVFLINQDKHRLVYHHMVEINDISDNKHFRIVKVANINKILQSIPQETAENEIIKILGKYPDKTFIGETENIDFEKIAYYQSHHFYGVDYGIYINLPKFAKYIINTKYLLNKYCFDEVRDIVVEKVLQHERFHYLLELFISSVEIDSNNFDLYIDYSLLYSKVFATDKCFEEALANYFAKMHFIDNGKANYTDDLNKMFGMQMAGYRLARDIDKYNEAGYFEKLEKQVFELSNYYLNVGLLDEVRNNYLCERNFLSGFEFRKKLNIPIFIVDDENIDNNDFIDLIKFIFPKL